MARPHDDELLDAALEALPIFPLPRMVLFPHALVPLHIFEPRYRAMLADCLATHRAMALVLIREPEERDEHGHPAVASVAGAGVIVEHQPLPDGRSNLLLHGRARVRLTELPFVPPYRRARAERIADTSPSGPSSTDRSALLATAGAFCADVRRREPSFGFRLPDNLPAGVVADLCAHHLVVDARVRQALLEERDPSLRVSIVTAELARQHVEMLRAGGALN